MLPCLSLFLLKAVALQVGHVIQGCSPQVRGEKVAVGSNQPACSSCSGHYRVYKEGVCNDVIEAHCYVVEIR